MFENEQGNLNLDNQGDTASSADVSTETTEQTQESTETQEVETDGATSTTETEKPEFQDPNMQKKFTQRMQEFSAKEKEFTESKAQLDIKARAFENLAANPKFVDWYRKELQPAIQGNQVDVSDQEFFDATQDKGKFMSLVDKVAEARGKQTFEPKFNALKQEFNSMQTANDISLFADAEGHDDFWELDSQGKIEPILSALRNADMTNMEKIDMAWKMARHDTAIASAKQQRTTRATEKLNASGEKGTSMDVSTENVKAKNMREFFEKKAKELGYKETP
jgi:hypothetical protein